jgi:hypothetical protein
MSLRRLARAVGDSDNRGIGGSQRNALIRIHQVGNLRIVGARQVDGRKAIISQDRREQRLHAGTGFAGQVSAGPEGYSPRVFCFRVKLCKDPGDRFLEFR